MPWFNNLGGAPVPGVCRVCTEKVCGGQPCGPFGLAVPLANGAGETTLALDPNEDPQAVLAAAEQGAAPCTICGGHPSMERWTIPARMLSSSGTGMPVADPPLHPNNVETDTLFGRLAAS